MQETTPKSSSVEESFAHLEKRIEALIIERDHFQSLYEGLRDGDTKGARAKAKEWRRSQGLEP